MDRRPHFAIVGTRGIPAKYGGFETFAEELSSRLAVRGYDVRVYCRERYPEAVYKSVRLIHTPTIRHKYLDTIANTFVSTLHLLTHPVEVALYCNGANAIFTWIPRLRGMRVALNVDGLERHRKKWNRIARAWYLVSERLSTFCPNVVVTDAAEIERYYAERYGKSSVMIPYGADTGRVSERATLDRLGLTPGRYFLYVSRMEPENNALFVREAFEGVQTDMKLVLVGDAPYAQDYIARVRETSDPRIVIPGAIYGDGYRELGSHCFAYIQATEVGGTHPALIENMARGALTMYLDTPENREVAGGAGIPFTHEDFKERMREVLEMSAQEREVWSERAVARVSERYTWDAVTDAYERLILLLAGGRTA